MDELVTQYEILNILETWFNWKLLERTPKSVGVDYTWKTTKEIAELLSLPTTHPVLCSIGRYVRRYNGNRWCRSARRKLLMIPPMERQIMDEEVFVNPENKKTAAPKQKKTLYKAPQFMTLEELVTTRDKFNPNDWQYDNWQKLIDERQKGEK